MAQGRSHGHPRLRRHATPLSTCTSPTCPEAISQPSSSSSPQADIGEGEPAWLSERNDGCVAVPAVSRRTTSTPRSSLLGALLLSPDAIAAVAEMGLGPEDFYKPAHQHIYDAIRMLIGGRRAGRRGHRRRRAAPGRAARRDRWSRPPARAADGDAGHLQRRPVRPHRPGHRAAAPPHRGGGRDRRDRLRRARRRHARRSTRPRRRCSRWPSSGWSTAPDRCRDLLGEVFDDLQAVYERGERGHRAWPPATTTSTSCSPGCSRTR